MRKDGGEQEEEEVLTLIYEHWVRERDRLRDARKQFTAQLGPFPAAAALALGLFAALPDEVENQALVWAALGVFLLMVTISGLAIRFPSYRELVEKLDQDGDLDPSVSLSRRDWLQRRIALEQRVYHGTRDEKRRDVNLETDLASTMNEWLTPDSLSQGFQRERKMLILVQALLAVEVSLLLLSRLLA